MHSKRISIHDTTLRDGEQMPGVVFSIEEKLELAEKFVKFGVSEIDIMPAVSASEASLANELAKRYGDSISATCRLKKEEIDQIKSLGIEKIVLFAPVSDIFLENKFKMSRSDNLKRAIDSVKYAKKAGMRISFAGMDSTRADYNYLKKFIHSMENFIDVFYLADTVGHLRPSDVGDFVSGISKNSKCRLGLHMHNDFSMAIANTIEGLRAGADVFSGTFTGIGERAGNAPIEEVCISLKCLENTDIGVRYDMIKEICDLVEKYSGIRLQPHKPVIGSNIFSHESGIHSDAVIKHPRTFEPFEPELIGCERRFFFGKHSGRGALKHLLEKSEIPVSDEKLSGILEKVKIESEIQKRSFSEDEVLKICNNIHKQGLSI